MKEITIKVSTDTDFFSVQVDRRMFKLQNGQVVVPVRTGQVHYVSWFVRGRPLQKYTIGITVEGFPEKVHSGTLDHDRKDFGLQKITI